MFFKSLLNLSVSFFLVSTAGASGWVTSGGELFRDGKNPWFVKNTSTVRYCLKVDKVGFSASTEEIEKAVKEGFAYWKDEFNRSVSLGGDGTFRLGTQTFEQVECSDQTDIQFYFGYGTLSEEQIAKLENPQRFIGVTVRTDYKSDELRGKGFLFFSSDQGEKPYDNPGTLIEKAWSRPRILKYAILHELGHVFGIPHMGSGLMSEVFLNQILNKNLVETYEKAPIDSFLRPSPELEVCGISPSSLTFLGIPQGHSCVVVSAPAPIGNWNVFAKKDKDAPKVEVGEIRNVTPNLLDQRGRPATILEITKEQKVFTPQETAFRSFMVGPMMLEMGMTGTYVSNSTKRPTPVYSAITPSSLTIQGQISPNRLEPVFVFNSPISLLLLLSPKP